MARPRKFKAGIADDHAFFLGLPRFHRALRDFYFLNLSRVFPLFNVELGTFMSCRTSLRVRFYGLDDRQPGVRVSVLERLQVPTLVDSRRAPEAV
jgi:hypothetical protein